MIFISKGAYTASFSLHPDLYKQFNELTKSNYDRRSVFLQEAIKYYLKTNGMFPDQHPFIVSEREYKALQKLKKLAEKKEKDYFQIIASYDKKWEEEAQK